MRDLKQLLEPLERREMPDRWDAIQSRPLRSVPSPPRSRVGAYAGAALVAIVAIAVVARLGPLGSETSPPLSESSQPPEWLAETAYRFAYQNGDMVPDRAAWSMDDLSASLGMPVAQGPDPSVPLYSIVLYGDFTAYGEKGIDGGSSSTGTIAFARVASDDHQVVAWGVSNETVDLPDLQPLILPDPAHVLSSSEGWRIAVPPPWQTQQATITWDGAQVQQTILSTVMPGSLAFAYEPMPIAAALGFPADGVALVVTATPMGSMAFAPHSTPLSFEDFERSRGADGSTEGILLVQGPDRQYAVTVRIGPDTSVLDRAALDETLASLTFG